jgi:hypothetical protein
MCSAPQLLQLTSTHIAADLHLHRSSPHRQPSMHHSPPPPCQALAITLVSRHLSLGFAPQEDGEIPEVRRVDVVVQVMSDISHLAWWTATLDDGLAERAALLLDPTLSAAD